MAEQQNILIKILADVAGANASFGKLQKTLGDLSNGTIALSKNFNAFQQGVSGSIGAQKAAEQVSKQYLQVMRQRLNISRAEVAGIKAVTEMHKAEAAAINAKIALQKAELAGDSVLLREMQQELQLRRLAVQEIELENRERRALNATKRQATTTTNEVTGAVQANTGAMGSASFALLSIGQAFQDSAQFGMGFAQGLRAVNNNVQQVFTALALGSVQAGGFANLLKSMGSQLIGPGGLIIGFSILSAGLEFFTTRAQRAKKETEELKESLDDLISITDLINNQGKVSVSIEQINSELARLNHLAAQARAPGSGGIVFDVVLGPGGQLRASRKTLAEVEAEIQELKNLLEEKNTGRAFLDFQSESERLSAISAGRIAELIQKNKGLSDTLAILSGAEGQRILDLRNEQNELEKQIELLEKIDALNRLPLMRLEMREQELIPLQTAISERMEEIQRSTTLVGRMQGAEGFLVSDLRTLAPEVELEMQLLGEVIDEQNRNINTSFKGWWNNNKDAVGLSAQLMQQSIGQIGSTFMQLAQTGDKQNKRLFETGKKFAIAQALISTYVGFTKAIEQGGPLGIITGASVLAAGMAKVQAIRSTTMSGGGGGGGSSAARGISSAPSFFTSFGNVSDFPASNVASLSAGGASGANISLVVQGRNLVGVLENEMQASSRRIGYSTGVFSGAFASSSSTRDVFSGSK